MNRAIFSVELINSLLGVARRLATDAIASTLAGGGDPQKIAEAQQKQAYGDELRDDGRFKDAAAAYKDALAKADGALP